MGVSDTAPPDALALRVARLLRHEIGDVLQGVYATASVLLSRFGTAQALEHRLVSDLKNRAEILCAEMDGVVRLLDKESPRLGNVDLAGMAQAALASLRRRTPDLPIRYEGPESCSVVCDAVLLPEALPLLVTALSQGARSLLIRITPGPVLECLFERQGHAAVPEQLAWIDAPFQTTQQGLLGVALAMTARAITCAGGVAYALRLDQGVAVRLELPTSHAGES